MKKSKPKKEKRPSGIGRVGIGEKDYADLEGFIKTGKPKKKTAYK